MLCSIYKTNKKEEMYLFISRRDDFSQVPETLLGMFGQPKLVVTMNLTETRKLPFADTKKVLDNLTTTGFYLQMPPPPVNHLDEYKKWRDENK
ncbi:MULTISPECIES: YcgL domain-containing protein [unclassified Moritella]|uniref:YcgL domain-containing protein n=1 Tax=unclassified Moritella TaxID=2637987 RepID=UPI001BAB73F3|nr:MULTISPECIES: YcgL domain-containing protein [unclassified Moritella]QUM80743.1 YcgL domain-containing protein [Moritella sp. 5]QUM85042.1 YcgL domain-containing protein [Moritella sp. 28]QUM89275.1 YcgL domain-containing protein [Moritella sp. 36]